MMKTKIKEVQDYFKGKIMSCEYEFEVLDYYIKLTIDGEYVFHLWSGNLEQGVIKLSDVNKHSFMLFEFSEEEKDILIKRFINATKENNRRLKLEQFNKLKLELNETE